MKPGDEKRPFALVTGASGGIGREIARVLSRNGHRLVLVSKNAARLAALAEEIGRGENGAPVAIVSDLSIPGAAAGIAGRLGAEGIEIDMLVNNAGFGYWGAFGDSPGGGESSMIACNITALTELTKLVVPGMVERGRGRILNIASTGSFRPGPMMAVYFATKAYVLSFSEALSAELSGTGITVTALCPGPTATGFEESAGIPAGRRKRAGKAADPRDVAEFGYRSMMKGKAVAVHGWRNGIKTYLLRAMPHGMLLRASRKAGGKR